jgi:uncharacterized membrane protein YgcG
VSRIQLALHLPCLLAQVYGKGMAEKILALAAGFDKLEADVTARKAQLQPLVDAERQRQQDAAAAAQREQEEQQRRCALKETSHAADNWVVTPCTAGLHTHGGCRAASWTAVTQQDMDRCPITPLQGCRGCGGKGAGGGAEAPGGGGRSAGGSSPKRGQVRNGGLMGNA